VSITQPAKIFKNPRKRRMPAEMQKGRQRIVKVKKEKSL
jgi:hypothetical protein